MKFAVALSFALISVSVSAQQYFEGSIHYGYEIKAKSKKINRAQFQRILGDSSTLLFKDGNFRRNYHGGEIEFELYTRLDNKVYSKKRSTDTIYWYDCSKGGSHINDLKTSARKKEVLGMMCDELRIQYPDHIKTEYYNSDSISIDPQWYVDFKRNDQYKIDSIERSIFLRSEMEFSVVTIVSHATKVKRDILSMSVFDIPNNAILLKKE